MKKLASLLTVVFALVAGINVANAQCDMNAAPNACNFDPNVFFGAACISNPDTIKYGPNGCSHNDAIYIKGKKNIDVVGIPAEISEIRIDSIVNMPNGITYALTSGNPLDPQDNKTVTPKAGDDVLLGCLHLTGSALNRPMKAGLLDSIKVYLTAKTSIVPTYPIAIAIHVPYDSCATVSRFDAVEELAFGVYPNPASTVATMTYNLKNNSDVTAQVVSVDGRIVYSNTIKAQNSGDHTMEIPFANFSNGVYMVKLNAGGISATKRIVKE